MEKEQGFPKTLDRAYSFLDLPLEIRTVIYGFALVRGKIFVPTVSPTKLHNGEGDPNQFTICYGACHPPFRLLDAELCIYERYKDYEEYTRDRPPIFAGLIQGVNRVIQAEAELVFYGWKNQFIMPAGPFQHPAVHGENRLTDLWPKVPRFKNISFTFDMRDSRTDPCLDRWMVRDKVNRANHEEYFDKRLTQIERLSIIHDVQKSELEEDWNTRCLIIMELGLKFLELDMEECFCPMGCCRLVESVCTSLRGIASCAESLERIHVLGLTDDKEAAYVRSNLEGDDEEDEHGRCLITCQLARDPDEPE